jgi:hypothetical protein
VYGGGAITTFLFNGLDQLSFTGIVEENLLEQFDPLVQFVSNQLCKVLGKFEYELDAATAGTLTGEP